MIVSFDLMKNDDFRMEGEEKMYKELNKDENFSKPYPTWIIAYCLDTNSFFCNKSETFLLGI